MTLNQDPLLSIVVPAHNEQDNIAQVVQRLSGLLPQAGIRYEVIFVNDGSSDGTWDMVRQLCQKTPEVRGVCLSRQFGKEAAIYAGLAAAKGDCCVVMDCDLQHPPEKIPEMWSLWTQGYEIIECVKRSRGDEGRLHSLGASCFYKIISRCAGVDLERSSDFKLLDRKAMLVLLNLPEHNVFFRALSSWIGFRTVQIEFDVQPRAAGKTNWSLRSLIKYAVKNIGSFTSAPLHLVTIMGGIMLVAAVVQGIEALYRWAIGEALGGFTTVILLQLLTGSLLMISLGIIGYYVSRIFEEVKARPRYIVSETCAYSDPVSPDHPA